MEKSGRRYRAQRTPLSIEEFRTDFRASEPSDRKFDQCALTVVSNAFGLYKHDLNGASLEEIAEPFKLARKLRGATH